MGALFGDYEIAQPFAQLGRETYALSQAEKALDALVRFDGRTVESNRLRGMGARGWRTGEPMDGGVVGWIERSVTLADGERVRPCSISRMASGQAPHRKSRPCRRFAR